MVRRHSETALWRAMEEAQAALDELLPSPEALREEAAAAERLAHEHGVPPKSARVITGLSNKWLDFLTIHGEAYGFSDAVRPELARSCVWWPCGFAWSAKSVPPYCC